MIDAVQIYTDKTGRFPVVSSKGNNYIMVLYDYDGNVILAEPIKNRTTVELLRAFQVMEQKMTSRGLKPRLMRLDVTTAQEQCAIISFKDHLITGLCSTDKSFPMNLWTYC
jgi:hypothetical protein